MKLKALSLLLLVMALAALLTGLATGQQYPFPTPTPEYIEDFWTKTPTRRPSPTPTSTPTPTPTPEGFCPVVALYNMNIRETPSTTARIIRKWQAGRAYSIGSSGHVVSSNGFRFAPALGGGWVAYTYGSGRNILYYLRLSRAGCLS